MTTLRDAVEEYRFVTTNKENKTRRWYFQKLDVFVRWCEGQNIALDSLRISDIGKFLEQLKDTPSEKTGKLLSSYTLHGYAQVIKTFLNWAANEEMIRQRVPDNIPMPRVTEKIIEVFTREQIRLLFEACVKEETAILRMRDRACLALLLDTGVRASELCSLTVDNVFLKGREPYIKVMGKGRKEREIGLGRRAAEEVNRYISRFRRADPQERHLVLNRLREEMSPDGLDQMLYRLRDWAGISGVRCSAHTFRHTFAVNFLLGGGDVYVLSRLLGHEKISTTEIYLKAVKQRQARTQAFSVLDSLDQNR